MKTITPFKMSANDLQWLVAQVRPNMLAKARSHLENQSFEYFAPIRQETIMVGDCFRQVERLLFPSYIFVRCVVNSVNLSALKATIGLSRVVRGMGDGPGVISDSFVNDLRHVHDLGLVGGSSVREGDKVRLVNGPFVGMVGEVLNTDSNGRLRILFEMMAGTRSMQLSEESVEVQSR